MLPVLFCLLCIFGCLMSEKEPTDPDSTVTKLKEKFGLYGGNTTTIDTHPYAVAIYALDEYYVGAGAIVGSQWILTSASNVYLHETTEVKVRTGSNYSNKGGNLLEVERIIVHNQFDRNFDNNLALIKTKQKIAFGTTSTMIELATEIPAPGSQVVLCGWGTVSIFDSVQTSHRIKEGNMTVFNMAKCKASLPGYDVTDQNICTTATTLVTCRFNGGDPLVYHGKLVGINSGNPSCLHNGPTVFVSIPKFRKWIEKQIKNNDRIENTL